MRRAMRRYGHSTPRHDLTGGEGGWCARSAFSCRRNAGGAAGQPLQWRMIRNVAAYQFVDVDDPHALAAAVRTRATDAALRGTVLVAPEGINLFLAGERAAVDGFMAWLRGDARFAAIRAKYSQSEAIPFARLKVKVKREIIAFRRDDIGDKPAPALSTCATTRTSGTSCRRSGRGEIREPRARGSTDAAFGGCSP